MADEYTLDKLLSLRKRLASVVGDELAGEWIKERFRRNVRYDLPLKAGGKYTAYGNQQNIDVQPEKFLPGQNVTVVPIEKWHSPNVGGEYSPLAGVRVPNVRTTSHYPENVLVHEMYHETERGGLKSDDATSKGLFSAINSNPAMSNHRAFTGRESAGEVIAELRDYQSQMPAWSKLQATDWFKNLPNEVKAYIFRKFNPVPSGVDAMTGASPSE